MHYVYNLVYLDFFLPVDFLPESPVPKASSKKSLTFSTPFSIESKRPATIPVSFFPLLFDFVEDPFEDADDLEELPDFGEEALELPAFEAEDLAVLPDFEAKGFAGLVLDALPDLVAEDFAAPLFEAAALVPVAFDAPDFAVVDLDAEALVAPDLAVVFFAAVVILEAELVLLADAALAEVLFLAVLLFEAEVADELLAAGLALVAPPDFELLPDDLDALAPFFGTFEPSLRASERPMAIACLRSVTFLSEPPLFSLPAFISCITFSTLFCDFLSVFAIQNIVSLESYVLTVQFVHS
jgi:hypothetical protein